MDLALATLLRLLTDDHYLVEVESMVRRLGVTTPEVPLDAARLSGITAAADHPVDAHRLSRAWYVHLVESTFENAAPHEELRGRRTFIAYLVAGFAARAGRFHDARRWLLAGHVEAEADGLGADEVALFVAAVRQARG